MFEGAREVFKALTFMSSKRDSLIVLVDILGAITDKMSTFFDFGGLNHEQFEKIRSAIASGLSEIVERQTFPKLGALDRLRKGGFPTKSSQHLQCFQPNRGSRLLHNIHELESKLDLDRGYGVVVTLSNDSFKDHIAKISSDLPATTFKWRKVRNKKINLIYRGNFYKDQIMGKFILEEIWYLLESIYKT